MARRGLYAKLRGRLAQAEERGTCVIATSRSDARTLNKAVARGDLITPAQGVYALPETWRSTKPTLRDLAVARSLQELHPDWVFCGVTAALAQGLAVSFSVTGQAHVVVSRRAHSKVTGMRGVKRHVVEGSEVVEASGLRVTSIERTVFDCLRDLGFREGLAIADSALHKSLTTTSDLRETFVHYPHRLSGRQRALDTLTLSDGRAESGGESVARAVMIERGFRLPELQRELHDPMDASRRYRVDFYWGLTDGAAVIGELDGREKYVNPEMTGGRSTVDVLADERLRESRVSAEGAKILRFSYAQVLDRAYFTRLLCAYGIPRDAEVPWVAQRPDDAEAQLNCHERLFLGRWLTYAGRHGLPLPQVA